MDNKKNTKDLLYIAGRLFSESDKKQRIYEGEKIKQELQKYLTVFNPLTDNPANDKSKLPTAFDVFKNDTTKIINSKYIFTELDGEDAGVMMELGIAYGINYILNLLQAIINDMQQKYSTHPTLENKTKVEHDAILNIIKLLETIPYKEIIAHLTDIRVNTAEEYSKHYIPYGYNQYVIGGIETMGEIYTSTDEAIQALKINIMKRRNKL